MKWELRYFRVGAFRVFYDLEARAVLILRIMSKEETARFFEEAL
jgi:mRNA-degrading endonuclease RelE of RelBE toxin-antitoxin system